MNVLVKFLLRLKWGIFAVDYSDLEVSRWHSEPPLSNPRSVPSKRTETDEAPFGLFINLIGYIVFFIPSIELNIGVRKSWAGVEVITCDG